MRYRKPFTLEQRRDAVECYDSFREHYRLLALVYAPSDTAQRRLLRAYADAIRQFRSEIEKRLDRVDPQRLNELERAARAAFAEYAGGKMESRLENEDTG